jgi:hypothetical protein
VVLQPSSWHRRKKGEGSLAAVKYRGVAGGLLREMGEGVGPGSLVTWSCDTRHGRLECTWTWLDMAQGEASLGA